VSAILATLRLFAFGTYAEYKAAPARFCGEGGALSPPQLLALFTFVNVLNYVDRGIVPGAFDSIGAFMGMSGVSISTRSSERSRVTS
jgi:hypothetical protein